MIKKNKVVITFLSIILGYTMLNAWSPYCKDNLIKLGNDIKDMSEKTLAWTIAAAKTAAYATIDLWKAQGELFVRLIEHPEDADIAIKDTFKNEANMAKGAGEVVINAGIGLAQDRINLSKVFTYLLKSLNIVLSLKLQGMIVCRHGSVLLRTMPLLL